MRIASLLASSTEIVAALDLTEDLVAVSHCCDWPPEVTRLPALTSALFEAQTAREIDEAVRAKLQGQDAIYALDAPALAALKPDLVISQALCDALVPRFQAGSACICRSQGSVDTFAALLAVGIAGERLRRRVGPAYCGAARGA